MALHVRPVARSWLLWLVVQLPYTLLLLSAYQRLVDRPGKRLRPCQKRHGAQGLLTLQGPGTRKEAAKVRATTIPLDQGRIEKIKDNGDQEGKKRRVMKGIERTGLHPGCGWDYLHWLYP
eukprot:1139442-Pelagomonas_calceolata.AAC.1